MIQHKPHSFYSCPRCGFVCVQVSVCVRVKLNPRLAILKTQKCKTYCTSTHTLKIFLVHGWMIMDRRFITITVMQMLHTHEAVQASEVVSDKQLFCGQFEYKNTLSTH